MRSLRVSSVERVKSGGAGGFFFLPPPPPSGLLFPLNKVTAGGGANAGPPVVVVFVLRWKRADGKGCGLISTYLHTEDTHALRAIRENTAAVTSGRDPAPRSACHEIQTEKLILSLSQSSPSLPDMGPINQCKQPPLSGSVSVFARPVVQLRLQLRLPRASA